MVVKFCLSEDLFCVCQDILATPAGLASLLSTTTVEFVSLLLYIFCIGAMVSHCSHGSFFIRVVERSRMIPFLPSNNSHLVCLSNSIGLSVVCL
jgi:hypothetical protein